MEMFPGFTVYRNGDGPVFVSMHAGHAFESVMERDDNSDCIGALCWKKYGGTLVLSTVTRNRFYGIDFNRDIPPQDIAFEFYNKPDKIEYFKKRYAFVAKNPMEYKRKLRIYNEFWSYVRTSGNFFVFLHRHYARIKNYPSLMDLVTFRDIGIKKEILQKIVDDINESYRKFFRRIEKDLKRFILLEERRILELGETECLAKDIRRALSWFYEKRENKNTVVIKDERELKNFLVSINPKKLDEKTKKKILKVFNLALKNMPSPRITLEKIFSAEMAIGPIKQILKSGRKIALEIEINEFLSRFYPEKTAEIVINIINKIRDVDMYKKMGFTQYQIMRFIK